MTQTLKENYTYPKERKGGLVLDLRKPQKACAPRPKPTTARPKKVGGIKKSTGPAFGLGMASLPTLIQRKMKRGGNWKEVRRSGREGQQGQGQERDGRSGKGRKTVVKTISN